MAVNIFRNVARDLTITGENVYTTPALYSGIILMAQVSNVVSSPATVSMYLIGVDSTATSLLTNFSIPGYDALGALTGKLVLEPGQSLFFSASDNTSLKLVMSILESKN